MLQRVQKHTLKAVTEFVGVASMPDVELMTLAHGVFTLLSCVCVGNKERACADTPFDETKLMARSVVVVDEV